MMDGGNVIMNRASRGGDFKTNNFDLIRLLAALQVLIFHATHHLDAPLNSQAINWAVSLFPGVPIFFFVSGFLISSSFETNNSLRDYTLNRVLRIYPALIVCLGITVALLASTGYLQREFSGKEFLMWVVCQMTFLQFFNPDFLRGFGVGVVNGSLWTISVELQFYVLVPCLYALLTRLENRGKRSDLVIAGLLLLFLVANRWYFAVEDSAPVHLAYKLMGVSFIPWFYMFLLGVLAQRHFATLHQLLAGKGLYLLGAYVFLMFAISPFGVVHGNALGPFSYVVLALVVFSCAYSLPMLSRKLLRGNDISYGVYIYHMPVVNVLLELGFRGRPVDVVTATALTVLLACFSWFVVERPALRLKRHSINPLSKQDPRASKVPLNSGM